MTNTVIYLHKELESLSYSASSVFENDLYSVCMGTSGTKRIIAVRYHRFNTVLIGGDEEVSEYERVKESGRAVFMEMYTVQIYLQNLLLRNLDYQLFISIVNHVAADASKEGRNSVRAELQKILSLE